MFFIRSSLSQEFPSHLDFTLTDLLRKMSELLVYLDFFCKLCETWGSELVLSVCWLIIHASCEKKIDQKHPGETNPCCLCHQLRHKLNTRHELKDVAEKNRTDPSQAKRRGWRGASKGRAARCPLKPGHGDKDVGKDPAAQSGQKFLRGGREQLRFLKAALQIKQAFVEMFKKKKQTPTTSSWDEDEPQHLGLDGRSKEEHWGTSVDAEAEAVPAPMRWKCSVKCKSLCFLLKKKKCSEMFPKWNFGSVC